MRKKNNFISILSIEQRKRDDSASAFFSFGERNHEIDFYLQRSRHKFLKSIYDKCEFLLLLCYKHQFMASYIYRVCTTEFGDTAR
jgi:hypothetical protein